jgi:hypothetical protein
MLSEARKRDVISLAVANARKLASKFSSVHLTHFLDAATLAAVKPDEPNLDLDLQTRMNRAAAQELLRGGVELSLQIIDRDAYFAWLGGRPNTAEARSAFRDPSRLLHGEAAARELGLDLPTRRPPRARRNGAGAGSPADRLVRAFLDGDTGTFDELAEDLISSGRSGVIDMAVRKVAGRQSGDVVEEFTGALTDIAEADDAGDGGWAAMTVIVAAMGDGGVPDAAIVADGLCGSGAFPDGARFLPAWRTVKAVLSLHPCSLRRVLRDLMAGREPDDLPPATAGELAETGFPALVGVAVHACPAKDGQPDDAADERKLSDMMSAYWKWAEARAEAVPGLALLDPVPPSEVASEIDTFLDGPDGDDGGDAGAPVGLGEIRDFVEMAVMEAEGGDAVCHVLVTADGGLDLTVATRAGRVLDQRILTRAELPADASAIILQLRETIDVVPVGSGRVAGGASGDSDRDPDGVESPEPSPGGAAAWPNLRSLPGGRA